MHRTLSGRVIFYLLFLLVMDMSVTPLIAIGTIRPLLIYLMIVYVALEWHWPRTFPIAVVVGLMLDCVGAHPFGVETVSLAAASFVLDFLIYTIEHNSWVMRFIITFIFVFSSMLMVWVLSSLLSDSDTIAWYSIVACLQAALYTTLIMPLFCSFTSRWFSKRSVVVRQYELFDGF